MRRFRAFLDLSFVYISGDLVYSVFAFQVGSRVRWFRFRVKSRNKEADRGRTENERNKSRIREREESQRNKEEERNGEWETDSGNLAYTVVSLRFSFCGSFPCAAVSFSNNRNEDAD